MDSFTDDDNSLIEDRFITRREKKKPSNLDWRRKLVFRKAARLKTGRIGVIGAENSGRNTLVRRFLNMDEGPFDAPQVEKTNSRTVLVDLSQISSIRQNEIVRLDVRILNARSHSHDTFKRFLPDLQIIALVFDVTLERTMNIAVSCMYRIRQQLANVQHPKFILLGNKIDIAQDRNINLGSLRRSANSCGAAKYYECSALMNINMDKVLEAILLLIFYPETPL